MSKDILGSVVRALVTVPEQNLGMVKDFIHKITGGDSVVWIDQGKLFLQQKACWTSDLAAKQPPKPKPSLLEFISTVVVPASTEKLA